MTEALLHMVWRFQLYDSAELLDHRGNSVEIVSVGTWNHDEGPDFLDAQLKINGLDWYGHVEIHKNSSEWMQHKHSENRHYDNVIAHVVFKDDHIVRYNNTEISIPTIALDGRIYPHILRNYSHLHEKLKWIPCSGQLSTVYSSIKWESWSERLLVERLQSKMSRIVDILKQSNNNWSHCFFVWISYGFGLKVNGDSMLRFALRIQLNHIEKYQYDPEMIQAVFFGLAGMLDGNYVDDYPQNLKEKFAFIKNKHGYQFSSPILWKFHRMRPVAFPTIRLSQLAVLLQKQPRLLSTILECERAQDVVKLLKVQGVSYWENHSKWDVPSEKKSVLMGDEFINRLMINVVAPFIYCYGKEMGQIKYVDRAIGWMLELKAENNKITRSFKQEGIEIKNASHSQALYHLKQAYCDHHRCMECVFGFDIVNNKS